MKEILSSSSMNRLFLLFLFIFLAGFSQPVQQTEAEEYNLKAVFIYNFTKYVTWETTPTGGEFTIGILGSSPIISPLNEIAKTKMVNNKRIIIRRFRNPADITFTNILFIPRNESYSIGSLLAKIPSGTLTVSEEDGMAIDGTAINFVIDNNKLKFEANLNAIASSGLKVSAELLQHAIIVNK